MSSRPSAFPASKLALARTAASLWACGLAAAVALLLALLSGPLATRPAAAADAFAHSQIAREADSYEKYLERFRQDLDDARHAALLKRGTALLKEDARAAARVFASAVASRPRSAESWQGLAAALLGYDPKTYEGSERYNVPVNAAGAAYRAHQLASDPREKARALDLLSEALVRRSFWRPAIESLKIALANDPDPARRQRLDKLRAEHGLRMTDYSTEADTAEPRVCLEFSEPLSRTEADFAKFVTVGGKDPQSLSVEGQKICLGGFDHGQRYEIGLRAGLPSDVGERLEKDISIAAYVPDRKASVRFTGRAYVLPSRGQQGIPLVTVNTEAVKVEVFRIGDRALVETLQEGDLGRQLSTWELENIKGRKGEQVYDGVLSTTRKLNEEVTTAFPVGDAIGALKPGVYAMTAVPDRPGDHGYQVATQWFIVSDLGLTAFTGDDGLHAFVRSLEAATPTAGTEVRLVARNNEVLATATTDALGHARFDKGLIRGEGGAQPAMLVARNGATDYAFLDLTTAAFDLTDRGVKGREPSGPIDAYLYAERGVYRPGEDVHLAALVRDAAGRASTLPVTLIVTRPDGVEHRRVALTDGGIGGRATLLSLSSSAMTGTWRARLHVDPADPALSEVAFLVEDFVPERLDMTLTAKAGTVKPEEPAEIAVEGRFLYGPPADDLALEGEILVRASKSGVPGYAGYRFGQADELVTPTRETLADLPRTAADGTAIVSAALPSLTRTAQPLEAQVILRLAEPSGRTIERSAVVPVDLGIERIGIKPLFDGDRLGDGEEAGFDVVHLGADGKPSSTQGLEWTLKRLDTRWQWYSRDGSWNYEPVTVSSQVATGTLDAADGKPARISAAVEYGRYILEVVGTGDEAPISSYAFNAGWFASADAPDSPEVLDVALDKEAYKPGDTARLRIAARTGGRALVAILGGTLHAMQEVDLPDGGGSVEFTVGDDWGAGAYATALLYRPIDVKAKRMPQRALGLAWVGLDQSHREVKVRIEAPDKIRSGARLDIPVVLEGLSEGEEARVTVAAVDLGILNLTRYKAPAPEHWFNAQVKLGTDIRDYYGRLIDGMRAERGALRSGGDADSGMEMSGTPPVEATVAEFSGIVTVGPDGRASVLFDLPDFNGTVRVMAVAWTKTKTGHAQSDVIVRDPLALTVAAPRFLTLGDEVSLGLGLHNVEGAPGPYRIALTGTRNAAAAVPETSALADRSVELAAGQRVTETIALKPQAVGLHTFDIAITGPNGVSVSREINLDVKPPAGDIRRTTVAKLGPGESFTLGADLVDGLIADRTEVSLAVGPAARFDVAGLLASLDRYPYGCAEQTVSRALPLVYAEAVARRTGVAFDKNVPERIQKAVDRVFEMQDSSGAFGAWGPSSTNLWLTAYVADFLTRAREAGYKVDDRGFNQALDRLANFIAYAQDFESGGGDRAYALYVLARNGRAPMGELRYNADARLERFSTPVAKAQLGAALALMNDRDRAATAISAAARDLADVAAVSAAGSRDDYGSWLRDGAALLALSSETSVRPASLDGLSDKVADAALADRHTSTQEQAWLLLAVKALGDTDATSALAVAGEPTKAPFTRTLSATQVKAAAVTVTNEAAESTTAVVSVVGAALTPEPPAANGLAIERAFYSLDGTPVELDSARGGRSKVKQNERFVVVVRVTPDKAGGRVLLVDRLPAGLEVENPRLVTSGSVASLSWLKTDVSPEHTEFRDDRVVAAFDFYSSNAKPGEPVTVAYVVRAVTPGSYVHPAAVAEDMYAPERHARTAAGHLVVSAE